MTVIHPTLKKIIEIEHPRRIVDRDLVAVEFVVVGRNHRWKDWAPYDAFVDFNPHVDIEGG